ncbi:MAG: NADH-quinone oxidoreductase subunit C [Burkholderiales bacterium]|nr:NADH-quinone oxidoreductase subunit C [Burkholderiales bacterium]
MAIDALALALDLHRLPAALPVWHGRVDPATWSEAAHAVADQGGRLISLWGVDRRASGGGQVACVAYGLADGLVWLELQQAPSDDVCAPVGSNADAEGKATTTASGVPDLSHFFPCAGRMQRAMADLSGLTTVGSADTRPWLDHGLWPRGTSPLRSDAVLATGTEPDTRLPDDYPFIRVEGDGVHEIAVGPVHAGIIEPGHFRFSVVGEKVLRLEEHLGYVHKGIERRFTELAPLDAYRLAGRVSGDSTVAYAWAYCMALESAWNCEVPTRAVWLRALMLERERIANHLGDLGALGNDAAFAFGLAQFSRLREDWQRLSATTFGHRLMMDKIVPGGVAVDITPQSIEAMRHQCDEIEHTVHTIKGIYDEHAGLQDRFLGTGRVTPTLAAQLGLTGLAGRASGQPQDLRCTQPWAPYDGLKVVMATQTDGDVAARVAVRFDEVAESLRLIRLLCRHLALQAGVPGVSAEGRTGLRAKLQPPAEATIGAGWVEGWRGEVLVALELSAGGHIVRCHCHDPSWQNWPVLEHAVIGNIVPDFPLINKSFNLSYAGHDL